MTKKFSAKDIHQLDDNIEREQATIKLFNQAIQDEDHQSIREICEFVINSDNKHSITFSCGWQFHCLRWLTAYYITCWQQSPDGSPEESAILKNLMNCVWMHKWIVGSLPCDIGISKKGISEAIKSMRELYQNFEFSLAMVYKAQLEQNIYMGDIQAAKENFHQWQTLKKDSMNDCEACEQHSLIQYYGFIDEHNKVIQLARPILSGRLNCNEVPHTTYPIIINSLIQLGEIEEAEDVLNDAIELIRHSDERLLWLMTQFIQLAIRLNNHELAQELLDEFNIDVIEVIKNNHYGCLQYLLAIAPFNQEALSSARALAKDFDKRNGNHFYQNQLELQFASPILH